MLRAMCPKYWGKSNMNRMKPNTCEVRAIENPRRTALQPLFRHGIWNIAVVLILMAAVLYAPAAELRQEPIKLHPDTVLITSSCTGSA